MRFDRSKSRQNRKSLLRAKMHQKSTINLFSYGTLFSRKLRTRVLIKNAIHHFKRSSISLIQCFALINTKKNKKRIKKINYCFLFR